MSFLNKRHLIGFLVAPLAAPLVYFIVMYLRFSWPGYSLFGEYGFISKAPMMLLILFVIGAPIAYIFVVILGLPVLLIAAKLGKVNFASTVLGGGFIAILPILLLVIYNDEIPTNNPIYLLQLFAGAVVGAVFWFIAIRPPNKRNKNTD